MSRFLRNRKKTVVLITGLVFFIALMCVLHFRWYEMLIICVLYSLFGFLNECVCRRMWDIHKPFEAYSNIRNVDYLIIGDFCSVENYVPKESTYVQIYAPERGFNSSYQILRHTHSILKETGGTVIMAIGNSKQNFMVFDVPFLHFITIKKYNLKVLMLMSKFPLLFAPIDSLKFLKGEHRRYLQTQNATEELRVFCEERNYKLIYLEKV